MLKTACPYCHAAPGDPCRDDANRPMLVPHFQRYNAWLESQGVAEKLAMKKGVDIGARWRPGHVVKIDTDAGTFEEVNGPCHRDSEASIQRALLAKPKTQAPRVLDVLFDLMRDAI